LNSQSWPRRWPPAILRFLPVSPHVTMIMDRRTVWSYMPDRYLLYYLERMGKIITLSQMKSRSKQVSSKLIAFLSKIY
jgi:hypothetical protein